MPSRLLTPDSVRMMVLWGTLLVLHHGYALVPVITVHLGEPVTFTCVTSNKELGSRQVHWYMQAAGDTLKLIVKQLQRAKPEFMPQFSNSRLEVNIDNGFANLTIRGTIQEDEGMYHCVNMEWINIKWSGTYLLVKETPQRASNYTVIQWPTVSDPVRLGDSVTLQCSVLSENKMCPGGHSVYWFRAGEGQPHPDIIYTHGNRREECERKPDAYSPPKSCVYRFSKKVSSSDSGTYYCAVATCREILFGGGTKLQVVQTSLKEFIVLGILTVCLAISVVGNVVFICNRRVHEQYEGMESATSQARTDNLRQQHHDTAQVEAEDVLNYAALNFSERKATRGSKKKDITAAQYTVYSQIKC